MSEHNSDANQKPREDIVVSVCFSDFPASLDAFSKLETLVRCLDRRFRFREIVLIVDDTRYEDYLPLVSKVSELRLLSVRPGNSYYERRVIAAEESIGDIVLITNFEEISHVNIVDMLEQGSERDIAILATRSVHNIGRKMVSSPLIALGRVAGFKVSLNDLQTIVLPRTHLNQVLSHSTPELSLRFPPRDPRFSLSFYSVEGRIPFRRGSGTLRRRLQLLRQLLVYLAPSLLSIVALSSVILMLLGMFYGAYVLGVWFFVDGLTPGWLTTSAMLSLSAVFMGVSTLGISLGLQQVLEQGRKDGFETVVHEVNRVDLFGKVASDLNVDLQHTTSSQIKDFPE